MILIGVCGKAGAGKDTVGDRVERKHDFCRYALADPIKDMLEVIGVDARDRNTREGEHHVFDKSPREMAQTLGTDWMRDHVDPMGWLKLAKIEYEYNKNIGLYHGLIITDVRFNNEADWIRENGVLIHVIRPNVSEIAAHSSENGISFSPSSDSMVENTKDIDFLNEQVDMIINAIKNSKHDRNNTRDTDWVPDSSVCSDISVSNL